MNAWTEFVAKPGMYDKSVVQLKNLGSRGVIAGGTNGSSHFTSIDYITISNLGNTLSFGTLNAAYGAYMVGCSNGSRGVNSCTYNVAINYLTIGTLGDTQNFGNLLTAKVGGGSCSNSYRGLVIGPAPSATTIEYLTIATLGNSAAFGALSQDNTGTNSTFPTSISNETTSLVSKNGYSVGKITIDNLSDATNFGNFSYNVTSYYGRAAGTNDSRCVFALGGYPIQNIIMYLTYSTLGNALDFGSLTLGRYSLTSCSYNHRVLFCGGNNSGSKNIIDYITLTQLSNAVDFGDISSQPKWCQCGYSGQ